MKLTSVLSWIVILVIAIGIPIAGALRDGRNRDEPVATQPSAESIDFQFEILGKTTFAISRMMPDFQSDLIRQMQDASKTSLHQTAAAIVETELKGAEATRDKLQSIDTSEARAVAAWYTDHVPIPEATVERLGWYGELAATSGMPASDSSRQSAVSAADKAMFLTIGAYALFFAGAAIGLCLFVTAIILLALGKLRFRVGRPQAPAHVYVEAFAIYLASYVLGALLIGKFLPDASFAVHLSPPVVGVLLAVFWPAVRGVSYRDVRADWGVHVGRNVFVEVGYGVLGYLAGLPIIVVGAAVMFLLIKLSGTTPSHPAIEQIRDHPILVAVLAVVFAPITEELIFRGAFVSHLRAGMGIVFSALVSGLIFAAIHPQGWTLIPVLGSIGAVLAIIRQWRGSLIPSITAHALHNGILITFSLLLSRS